MNVLTNTSRRGVVKDVIKRFQSSSSTVSSSLDIKIPKRIERGPTDILKALDKTVGRDPLAVHYRFVDDPHLIPTAIFSKRTFTLSYVAGVKAAKWIYQEHKDLFINDLADPVIPDFLPPVVYTEKEQVSEDILLESILKGKTSEALKIYNLLEKDVSVKAKLSLFELLCFSNSEDLDYTYVEERWFKLEFGKDEKRCTWVKTEEMTNLFTFLVSQSPEIAAAAYNALICGMTKFYNVTEAWSLYKKCKEDNIPLNCITYNEIIKLIPLLKGSKLKPYKDVLMILEEMSNNGIFPNRGTLNAALVVIYTISSLDIAMTYIEILLKIFKSIGIKPSLATYYHIINFAQRNDQVVTSICYDVLNVLKYETFEFSDPVDTHFFPTAMKISHLLRNRNLGELVHSIYLKDDNYKFISNANLETMYYRNYILLQLATIPTKEFFQLYRNLCTNIYIPEPNVIESILTTLEYCPQEVRVEYMPELWSQIIMFHMLNITRIVKLALHATSSLNIKSDSPRLRNSLYGMLKYWVIYYYYSCELLGMIKHLPLHPSWYVWPALNQLQVDGKKVFSVVKVYAARDDLVAMEDLRERGFTMADRRKGLTFEQLKLVLKALAGFHALSLTLREIRPDEFMKLSNSKDGKGIQEALFRTENEDWYRQYYQAAANNAIRMVSEGLPTCMEDRREEIMQKLHAFLNDAVFFRTMREIAAAQGPLTVFCHGDCWTNNVLFRDQQDSDTEDVYLVDFQLSRVGSLALDLANLLYCCTSGEVRQTYMTQLLQHYHFHLMSSLHTLNPEQPPKNPSVMWELLNEEMRRCGRFGVGLALDILPISTCASDEAPDLYEGTEVGKEERRKTRAPPQPGAECTRLMTDLVLELIHNHAL